VRVRILGERSSTEGARMTAQGAERGWVCVRGNNRGDTLFFFFFCSFQPALDEREEEKGGPEVGFQPPPGKRQTQTRAINARRGNEGTRAGERPAAAASTHGLACFVCACVRARPCR
jgi:hypothetical protein